jgi:hypothetical protein
MACVPIVDPTCNPVTSVITDGVQQIFEDIAKTMVETAGWAIKTLVTGWLMAPSPIMDNQDVVDNLRKYTYWITTAVAVAALLVAAGRMVLQASARPLVDAVGGLVKLVLVTSLAVPITIALTEFGDGYSRWIINASVGDGLDQRVAAFIPVASLPGFTGLTAFAVIGLSALCVLVSFGQILLSVAIGGLKIILSGVAPLPAAASIGGGGQATLARYLTWMGAVLLYKPAAATIYAAAFWMTGTGTSLETVLTGIVVIAGAMVALPALLRLLAPISAQVAAGGGAALAGGGVAAAGTVATGAVRLASVRGSGGSGNSGAARTAPTGGGGAPPTRSPAAGPGSPGPGGSGPTGPGGGTGPSGSNGTGGPAGATPATAGAGGGASGGAAAGAGAGAAGGGTAAAGGASAGGAAAAAGPAGIAVAAGAAAAKAGPAAVRKVGGLADGASRAGE